MIQYTDTEGLRKTQNLTAKRGHIVLRSYYLLLKYQINQIIWKNDEIEKKIDKNNLMFEK